MIGAYACEPGRGSEPGAGWAWTRAAALEHDVWLLTRANQAAAITAAMAQEPRLRLHPVYLDLPAWARFWKRGQRGVRLYYILWQLLAWRRGRRLQREIGFQVAHHLTFATDWMLAGLAWVTGPAFVWGPVGGSSAIPRQLWRWLGWRGCVGLAMRQIVTTALRRFVVRSVARRAALVVAQNHDVAQRLAGRSALIVEPNIALPRQQFPVTSGSPDEAATRRTAVFIGRLLPSKGLRLAVAALRRAEVADWVLHVYGDGRERRSLEAIVRRNGLQDRIVFHGHRPRHEIMAALQAAEAMLFPSMREGAPWAVAEALNLGCPVICLESTAPAYLVGDWEGSKVPLNGDLARGVAEALATMTSRIDPVQRWSDDRLPGLLRSWYELANGGPPSSTGQVPPYPNNHHRGAREPGPSGLARASAAEHPPDLGVAPVCPQQPK
jgi:glycosyltransferase involved in cell wall biosynthesis